jgi:hypothetical protein
MDEIRISATNTYGLKGGSHTSGTKNAANMGRTVAAQEGVLKLDQNAGNETFERQL